MRAILSLVALGSVVLVGSVVYVHNIKTENCASLAGNGTHSIYRESCFVRTAKGLVGSLWLVAIYLGMGLWSAEREYIRYNHAEYLKEVALPQLIDNWATYRCFAFKSLMTWFYIAIDVVKPDSWYQGFKLTLSGWWGSIQHASNPYEVVRIGFWGVERWTHANPVAGWLHSCGFDLEFIDLIPHTVRNICLALLVIQITKLAYSVYCDERVLAHDLTHLIIDEDLAENEDTEEDNKTIVPVTVIGEHVEPDNMSNDSTVHSLYGRRYRRVSPIQTQTPPPSVTETQPDESQRKPTDYVTKATPRSTARGIKSRLHTKALILRHELCRLLTADTKRDTPSNRATVDARARRLASSLRVTDPHFKTIRARDLTAVIETAIELYFVPTDDELQIQEQFTGNPEHIARKNRYRYPDPPSL